MIYLAKLSLITLAVTMPAVYAFLRYLDTQKAPPSYDNQRLMELARIITEQAYGNS